MQTFEYGRRSTLGADFYTKRIPNPAFGKRQCEKIANEDHAASANNNLSENGIKSTSTSAASLRSTRSGSSGSGLDSFATKTSQPQPDQEMEINETEWDETLTTQQHINLQMWDTAGRERFVSGNAGTMSSTLGDTFFEHADCAILVYDATSSRSFTKLLRWYAELTDRMKDREQNGDGNGKFPVIVVANKLDIIRSDEDEKNVPMRRRKVPQRDIMKLTNGFKGKDHRYEYTVSSSPKTRSRADTGDLLLDGRNRRHAHNQHHRKQRSLSYGLTDANWTTDNSYLNNIIKSEDGSFPDRDMVILWCMRNGLQHVEVSALDGDGILDAVQTMVTLAMEAKNEQKKKERLQRRTTDGADTFLQEYWASRGYGDEDGVGASGARGPALDLTARYTPNDDRCACCWRIIPFC